MKINLNTTPRTATVARKLSTNVLAALSVLAIALMLMPMTASAQTKTLTGIVRDEQQVALMGVSVAVKGTSQGMVTGEDGRFSLTVDVAKSNTLVLTFMGKKTLEVSIGDRTDFELTMYEDPIQLVELVVTGAGANDELYTEPKADKKKSRKRNN